MNATQTVDTVETFGMSVSADVTCYDGETLEDLTERVDLSDGENVVGNVRVVEVTVQETGRNYVVFRLSGVRRAA